MLKNKKAFFTSFFIVASGIAFDLMTPAGVAGGVIYLLFVLSAAEFRSPNITFIFAAISTVLTTSGYFLSAETNLDLWTVHLNRGLSILSFWIVAIIVYYKKITSIGLQQKEGRLQAVLDGTLDGIISINEKGNIATFNKACENIFGYKVEEVLGRNVKMLMPEPYHNEHDDYLKSYRDTQDKKIIGLGREVEGQRKDGSTFPLDLSVNEIVAQGDKMFSGIVRDVSDRKAAEERLKQSLTDLQHSNAMSEEREGRLQAVLDGTVDGIITIDERGTIANYNKACVGIFGYQADEVIGQNVKVLMPEPYHGEHDGYLKSYRDTQDKKIIGIGREVQGQRKDGSTFPLDLSVSEIDVHGKKMFSGIVRDITERKEAENKLMHTLEDLQLSNEELEKFAYVASHDLKSPLRAIDNLSLWLDEDLGDALTGKNKEYMDTLRGRVTRMELLLDDLLDYSRASKSELNGVPITANLLIKEITELLNIPDGFVINIDESLNQCNVLKSPLDLIFSNLIGNAIKHHDKPEGNITISIVSKDQYYQFTVEDDGPGIDPRFHHKVFEIFQTLKPRDEVEGSGMGMALVKKLLYKHGGRITLDSDPGQGSRFNFTWPK
ncbi:MAG: PAS domain S-box protein [Gammaproteobacteria bacterium]